MRKLSSASSSSSSYSSTSSSSPSSSSSTATETKAKRLKRNLNPEKRQFGGIPGRRSSKYRGVTRHRWTGRFEAHLWDKNNYNAVQNKKGKQVYLGAYDDEEAAARTYDLAALKYWGAETTLNFPLSSYTKEIDGMKSVSREEYLASLRRRSSGFSRGVSKYRGVARHHHNGRWEARIGRVSGNKYLYLGTYNTQEEAAAAYDRAAIEYRGVNAVTNFEISRYITHSQTQSLLEESNDANTPPIRLPPKDSDLVVGEYPRSLFEESILVSDTGLENSGGNDKLCSLFNNVGFQENIDFLFEESGFVGTHECERNGLRVVDGIFGESDGFGGDFLAGIEEGDGWGLTGFGENSYCTSGADLPFTY